MTRDVGFALRQLMATDRADRRMNQRRIGSIAGLENVAPSFVISLSADDVAHERRLIQYFGRSL